MDTILLVRHAEANGHDGEDPALGLRAFVVGSFVARELGAPPAAWMQLPIAHASLTELMRRTTGEWSVLGVSDVGHLVGI